MCLFSVQGKHLHFVCGKLNKFGQLAEPQNITHNKVVFLSRKLIAAADNRIGHYCYDLNPQILSDNPETSLGSLLDRINTSNLNV